jgi:hypothetical protein
MRTATVNGVELAYSECGARSVRAGFVAAVRELRDRRQSSIRRLRREDSALRRSAPEANALRPALFNNPLPARYPMQSRLRCVS